MVGPKGPSRSIRWGVGSRRCRDSIHGQGRVRGRAAEGTGEAGRGAGATAYLQPDADNDSSRLGGAGHGNGGPAVDDGRGGERLAGRAAPPTRPIA